MANKIVSVVTGTANNAATTAVDLNGFATDFISQGVVGSIGNTSGTAPATGSLAVNAQGSPNMTVAVSGGNAWITATPAGSVSQTIRVTVDAAENVTINSNTTGATRYDWVYMQINATNLASPDTAKDNVASYTTSRSTSNTVDNGTPPTYGILLAIVTVVNNATSITNGNIADKRSNTGLVAPVSLLNGSSSVLHILGPASWSGFTSTTYTTATSGSFTFAPTVPSYLYADLTGYYQSATAGVGLNVQLLLDGVQFAFFGGVGNVPSNAPTPWQLIGKSAVASANTSHTVALQVQSQGAGTFAGYGGGLIIQSTS